MDVPLIFEFGVEWIWIQLVGNGAKNLPHEDLYCGQPLQVSHDVTDMVILSATRDDASAEV